MHGNVGDLVHFFVEGYGDMKGTIDRIVKMSAPCVPSNDPKDWTLHIHVEGNGRCSGTFQVPYASVFDIQDWE
jgi:hypothetical protein